MRTKTFLFGLSVGWALAAFYGCKKEPARSNSLESAPALSPCDSLHITVDFKGTGGAIPAIAVPFTAVRCDGETGYLVAKDGGNVPDLLRSDYDAKSKSISLRSTVTRPKSGYGDSLRLTSRLELQSPVAISVAALPVTLDVAPGGDAGVDQSVNLIINHGTVTCSYLSVSDSSYKFSRCIDGVKNIPDTGVIENVTSLEFRVNGAAPNYITTVDLSVSHR